jgi:hypothetical protein
VRPSSFAAMISTSVSGEDCSASSTIASAPCSPGAAFAMRISTILRSANSDIERLPAIRACQSKPRSMTCSSRSTKPWLRAAARIASAASLTSNGSSPDTR